MSQDLKLLIELVPKTSWGDNLRKEFKRSDWDKLRKKVYADHKHRCGVCGSQERLNCHEIWQYDDDNHIQLLTGFIALCNMCHHIKHIGFANILASQGKLDFQKVVQHFMAVNQCDESTFKAHSLEATKKWKERSKHQWIVDLGEYSHYRPLSTA